jgi:uncharacterized phage-associated protein
MVNKPNLTSSYKVSLWRDTLLKCGNLAYTFTCKVLVSLLIDKKSNTKEGDHAKRTARAKAPSGRDRQRSSHCPDRDRRGRRDNTEATSEAQERLGWFRGASTEHDARGPQVDCPKGRSGEVGLMPNYDPRAVANEFLKLNGGPMNQMKLQKLVYMAHGWNLAINRQPLVSGRIEAWDGGPVMRVIWNHLRDFGLNSADVLFGNGPNAPFVAEMTADEAAIISHVWSKYGQYTGVELSEMTHKSGTPWSNSYFGRGRNAALSQADIQQHFIELALAGRQQVA